MVYPTHTRKHEKLKEIAHILATALRRLYLKRAKKREKPIVIENILLDFRPKESAPSSVFKRGRS